MHLSKALEAMVQQIEGTERERGEQGEAHHDFNWGGDEPEMMNDEQWRLVSSWSSLLLWFGATVSKEEENYSGGMMGSGPLL